MIGLPCGMGFGERRFPLTPEGAEQLIESKVIVKIESGAGTPIHYSDASYAKVGVQVCSRSEVLAADIVISPAPLQMADVKYMRRGALLITLLNSVTTYPNYAKKLLGSGINTLAADLINDNGQRLVADILHEIDGCASLVVAASMLANPIDGKGILLGGVAGVSPGEITILGSGMGAIAAAHNGLGLGATVRMFDNDMYSLRSASRVLNHQTIASALHPRVLRTALKSADAIIVTPMKNSLRIDGELASLMKSRALVFDLTNTPGTTFPSLPLINLGTTDNTTTSGRACYYNVGCQVPRTAAMALSNILAANIEELRAAYASLTEMPRAMRPGLLFYWGKCLNSKVAEAIGVRPLDVNLLIGN